MALEEVNLTHSSGSSATVNPYGATLTSFITCKSQPIIFVSKLAKRDGSKPVRGGIPLVFPQFGQPDKSMPQHGFLRRNIWTLKEESSQAEGDQCTTCTFELKLENVKEARGGLFAEENKDTDCTILYQIKLFPMRLETILTIENKGKVAFPFQTLFHTYYQIPNNAALNNEICQVSGLQGYSVEDKITNEVYEKDSSPILLGCEVDRIYTPPASNPTLDVTLTTPHKIQIQAKGSVDGNVVPTSVVVWNPFISKAKALSDFDDEEYHDMICVEPGLLVNVPTLECGKIGVFEQVISVL